MAGSIKKNYILDASFVIAFLLPDENKPEVDKFFKLYKDGLINFISTPLLQYEVGNGLKAAVESKRITLDYCKKRLAEFIDYQIDILEIDLIETFILAHKYKLSFYDAAYVYLARNQNLNLLTLDKKLQELL